MSHDDFVKFYTALERFGPRIPSVCMGPDGHLMISWDDDEHHLELELFPNKPAEIFYRNRKTEGRWGIE